MLLLFTPIAFAQNITEVKAGITPDNPFYFMDRWQEQVSLALTFNQQKKAQKHLDIANERIEEIREVENTDSIEQLQENLVLNLEKAQKNSVTNIELEIEQLQQRNQQVLNEIKNKLPLESQQGIDNAIQNSYINRNTIQNQLREQQNIFLKEFENETFEIRLNNSVSKYYKLENGKIIEFQNIEKPSYTIKISSQEDVQNLINKYNSGENIEYIELTEIIEIPLSLKTRALKGGILR